MDWVVSALLFIVALGSLICLHELGHFSMAKLFNVYCHEFSIGFGPAILHKRKQGKETYFSIRCIPIGGYVSMFGEEDAELEPGLKLPPERSLEGIAKWKKAIIVSAGIICNAVLAIAIFGVKNLCFPLTAATRNLTVSENSIAYNAGIRTDDKICYLSDSSNVQYSYEYTDDDGIIHAGYFYIVDNDVQINDYHYVLTFDYYTTKGLNNFNEGIQLFVGATKEEVQSDSLLNGVFSSWISSENAPTYYPNVKKAYTPTSDVNFDVDFVIERDKQTQTITVPFTFSTEEGYSNVGMVVRIEDYWPSFGDRFKQIWVDFGDSAVAVFKGLKVLFSKGGIKNMSGVVGIFATSKQLYSTQTFATYLKFWGLISVNLAIFNLLPFPGLDGWQLLVTAFEGITKKKIPTKFKTVMNLIGFGLLIILMIAILVVDIMRF